MNHRILQELFEAAAVEHAERPAVITAAKSVNYAELNARANRIAWTLKEAGLQPGGIVALVFDSSIEYICALLGVLKTGCAFMPIPRNIPAPRLAKVFSHTRPGALIGSATEADLLCTLLEDLPLPVPVTVLLDHQGQPEIHGKEPGQPAITLAHDNPPSLATADAGAYVIFTSGSTGEPKIILGVQKSLCHFLHWERQEFALDASLRTLSLAPPTFDVSLRDLLLPLSCGGAVCIPDPAVRQNIPALVRFVRAHGVNLIHCVPSLFREITRHLVADDPTGFAGVNHLLLAGEPLYGADVIRFREGTEGATELVNLYGPSETTLAKLFFRIGDEPLAPGQIVPVGRPINNTAALLLKNGRLCKIGEVGEIHIKTPYRSGGYLGAEELNAQVFIQNPLSDTPDIIYKTGDMGRYRPDRAVDFIGRLDRQVKLRGHRVELPEVEQAVAAIDTVRQVYVATHLREGLVDGLICYFTADTTLETAQLSASLQGNLPDYMIPAIFLQLEKFPLNLHGKVDPQRLPKPEALLYQQDAYVPPQTATEKQLAALFATTLGLERISVDSSLLAAGANSLTMIKLAGSLYRELGVNVDIATIFAKP
ncbi:MAG: non-ribosomal peptide synthetase, partial [Desulfuromonadales bacterium]|nr:non-ribosomal peptide synthetase [Desulfuromonadales bacterium]